MRWMIDEAGRHVGRLHDLAVRAGQVEEPAHRLRRVLGGDRDRAVVQHELVEVAEVVVDLARR